MFTRFDADGKPHTQTGTILNPPKNGGMVILAETGELILNPVGQVSLQKLPDGLHPKPTLNWMLRSDRDGEQDTEISYITEGIGWKADYVALVNRKDTALDLTGWVTLNNQSGTTYDDAKLTLMAGDVRRIQKFDLDSSILTKSSRVNLGMGSGRQFEGKASSSNTCIRWNVRQLSGQGNKAALASERVRCAGD